MRLVIDVNVLLSAFLRDGATRELLLHAPLQYYAPEWVVEEFERNFDAFRSRAGLSPTEASGLRVRLFNRIQIVPMALLVGHATDANARCVQSGLKDAPYVACALAVDASLWTHDQVLAQQAGVPVVSTAQLAESFLSR